MTPVGILRFDAALGEANFRAAVTRRRYRVRWDAVNHFWTLTELVEPVRPPGSTIGMKRGS